MALLSDYASGTVTIAANATTVTGSGTAWQAAGFAAGDLLFADGYIGLVGSVQSDTALTLAQPWRGGALTAAAYRLRYQGDGSRISAQARQLIELLGGSGNLEALGKIAGVADRLAYFTGSGQMATTALTSFARSLLGGVDAAAVLDTLKLPAILNAKADLAALNTKADLAALNAKADLAALDAKADKTSLNAKFDKAGGTITGQMVVQPSNGYPLVLIKPDNVFYGKTLRVMTGDSSSTGKGNGPQINFIKYNRAQWAAGIQNGDTNGSSFVINWNSHELQDGTTMLRLDPDGAVTITNNLYVGSTACVQLDGNVIGSCWSNWGYSDAYSAINARIEARATAWANDRISKLQYRLVSPAFFDPGDGQAPSGAVVTGLDTDKTSGRVYRTWYRYPQVYDPVRGWVGFVNA